MASDTSLNSNNPPSTRNSSMDVGRIYIDKFNERNDPLNGIGNSGSEKTATVKDIESIISAVREGFSNYIEIQRSYIDSDRAEETETIEDDDDSDYDNDDLIDEKELKTSQNEEIEDKNDVDDKKDENDRNDLTLHDESGIILSNKDNLKNEDLDFQNTDFNDRFEKTFNPLIEKNNLISEKILNIETENDKKEDFDKKYVSILDFENLKTKNENKENDGNSSEDIKTEEKNISVKNETVVNNEIFKNEIVEKDTIDIKTDDFHVDDFIDSISEKIKIEKYDGEDKLQENKGISGSDITSSPIETITNVNTVVYEQQYDKEKEDGQYDEGVVNREDVKIGIFDVDDIETSKKEKTTVSDDVPIDVKHIKSDNIVNGIIEDGYTEKIVNGINEDAVETEDKKDFGTFTTVDAYKTEKPSIVENIIYEQKDVVDDEVSIKNEEDAIDFSYFQNENFIKNEDNEDKDYENVTSYDFNGESDSNERKTAIDVIDRSIENDYSEDVKKTDGSEIIIQDTDKTKIETSNDKLEYDGYGIKETESVIVEKPSIENAISRKIIDEENSKTSKVNQSSENKVDKYGSEENSSIVNAISRLERVIENGNDKMMAEFSNVRSMIGKISPSTKNVIVNKNDNVPNFNMDRIG